MVSAWSAQNRVVLAQVKTEEKSNEITAIPRLLELLQLKGCMVTIDAMGCQKEIAKKIVDGGADYLLAVKENQPTLSADIVALFEEARKDLKLLASMDFHSTDVATRSALAARAVALSLETFSLAQPLTRCERLNR